MTNNQRNKSTLIVIDMAPAHTRYLPKSSKSILFTNVQLQLNKAVTEKKPVIVQVLPDPSLGDDFNYTHNFVTGALKNHTYKSRSQKDSNDGSKEILKICRQKGYPTQRIQLCGLFTNFCIRDTAVGLAKALPKSIIEVMRHACASTNPNDELRECFWNRFCEPNIVITPAPTILPWSANKDDETLYFSPKARDFLERAYDEVISM
jgi:hypothetical protein